MYLFSLEFGNPPLYAEVNRVMREMDFTQLELLGPFIQALGDVTCWGEMNKCTEDKIKTGFICEGTD